MKRTKLSERSLPNYSPAQERVNVITHAVGGLIGIIGMLRCLSLAGKTGRIDDVLGAAVYGLAMVTLYGVSSLYHGLKPSRAKKIMQVVDHCTIYFLIAGTYTPVLISAIYPLYPKLGMGLLAVQWFLAITACVLTAIDLRRYRVISMVCYIGMGWSIAFFLPQALEALTRPGFILMLSGGIAYTIGAILYGLGRKLPWMHSVFHIFVVLGSGLQLLSIAGYVFA